MCAILDASVCSMVFGDKDRPAAGKGFFEWINSGQGRLVVGGKLRSELYQNDSFKKWAATAVQYGLLKNSDDVLINRRERTLNDLTSNDSHIIALAIESHARLLCTNDRRLMSDFKNADFIQNPKGSIYSIPAGSKFDKRRRDLLQRSNCKRSD